SNEAISLIKKCSQPRTWISSAQHPHTTSSFKALNEWRIESLVKRHFEATFI
ncbi:hypothetical protein V2W45_1242462, partial [Cenococcum geophilum]